MELMTMVLNSTERAGQPAETQTFSQEKKLRQRLKRVPKCWIDPLGRCRGGVEADGGGPLRAWIVPGRDGTLERVRASDQTLGTKLLLNEFEALQAVQHENVVALRWAGRWSDSLAVATSWREIDRGEPPPHPLPWLLSRMAEATRGVAAIHRAGLVHGDLKPATILMGASWTLVTDLKGAAPPGRRQRSLFTPRFAAPEQVLGERVGPAADLYALGMTFYMLFIKDRFPLILRGAETAAAESEPAGEDEMPLLSAATTFEPWPVPEGRQPSASQKPVFTSAGGPDFLIGVKVRFRSQLSRVLVRAQHAGWVGEILRLVRTATQLEPSERFRTCEEFEGAINSLLKRLPEEVPTNRR